MTKYKAGKDFSLENIIEFGKDLSTFKLKGYQITGDKAIHPETKEPILIKGIFDEIRNVRNENEEIIAKRKNLSDTLKSVRKKHGR
ncbi:hypothetical protein HUN92_13780 [Bacillus firmus]|uniref:hypothetical protein n=1 Tax=Cytobacillus firmus TaxID=1399 RepID=UPI001580EDA5|nr:hypothetical protein [Cytobacillus firmus]NUH84790.1 hypothetical protein [Cytobacillus firmus]